jgi:hypothetical protein
VIGCRVPVVLFELSVIHQGALERTMSTGRNA